MGLPFKFHEHVDNDLSEAYEWYESNQTGLGLRFNMAVGDKLKQISENPDYNSTIYRSFRQAKVDDFPYTIVFELLHHKKYISTFPPYITIVETSNLNSEKKQTDFT